jgi:hypothetical protein
LEKYHRREFPAAKEAWSGKAIAAMAAPESRVNGPTKVGIDARIKWLVVRSAPALAGILVGFGIVVVGLETVFDPKTIFLENDVRDFVGLVAWGFGSALVGLSTTDLATRLMPKRPTP